MNELIEFAQRNLPETSEIRMIINKDSAVNIPMDTKHDYHVLVTGYGLSVSEAFKEILEFAGCPYDPEK